MSKLSPARRVNVGALLVAAAGVFIIFVSAPDLFPAVPPGILILAAAAAIVAFVPGRWTPIVGVLIPLVITIGGIANGTSIDILQGEENAGAILGTVIQYPALITATAAGTQVRVSELALDHVLVERPRGPSRPRAHGAVRRCAGIWSLGTFRQR